MKKSEFKAKIYELFDSNIEGMTHEEKYSTSKNWFLIINATGII